ncbi:hypothetical protein [Amycolatopsis sp. PS_44_ISF1]|uniref:hypothetical protein n=1 Tax=Amycolatopsis sp. PS_44_ISF1 TaxID=2974917 RepID=UPI0028E080F6|nr:hypothetical protein [Amycolatopsis sp. PS_44_ISF1]MDT8915789.1 hypothetical protein [Amycolatopsis sp. PS_44_ISF1]MDT8916193.1 hypothetical protein [Amycolatopsis sp. PS_44_ISF1]
MARTHAEAPELFRGAVTTTIEREGQEPSVSTYYYGPFIDRRQASAAVTRAKRRNDHNRAYAERCGRTHGKTVDGHVESTVAAWEQVSA